MAEFATGMKYGTDLPNMRECSDSRLLADVAEHVDLWVNESAGLL